MSNASTENDDRRVPAPRGPDDVSSLASQARDAIDEMRFKLNMLDTSVQEIERS